MLTDPSLPGQGPGAAGNGNFVLTDLRLVVEPGALAVHLTGAQADYAQDGYPVADAIDAKPDSGWAVSGGTGKPHTAVFTCAPLDLPAGATLVATLAQQSPYGQHLLGRLRLAVSDSATPPAAAVPEDVVAALAVAAGARSAAQQAAVLAWYRGIAPALAPARARQAELLAAAKGPAAATAMVMRERPGDGAPSTAIHVRGAWLVTGETVTAGVPAALPPLPDGAVANRLALARWLVAPGNPLTARVTVNRFWEQVFGTGIVASSDDFGAQGQPPSHPELLDWLASDFVGHGWQVKRLLRTIVTSATYRQGAHVSAAKLERDPANRLLARAPRFRVEAEMVRDVALAAAGLLSARIGGPSVFPLQPDGIWDTPYNGDRWETSAGEERWRRGLYTFWKRSSPYPAFTTFDAPSREVCMLRRPRTDTPLQALVTLNDVAFVDAARGLARRLAREGGATPASRCAYGFRLCTAHAADARQVQGARRALRARARALRRRPRGRGAAGRGRRRRRAARRARGAGGGRQRAAQPRPDPDPGVTMDPLHPLRALGALDARRGLDRRAFLRETALGLGALALGALAAPALHGGEGQGAPGSAGAAPPPLPAKAKNVIFLFMAGAPSQVDLFDHKPKLNELNGQAIPDSFVKGERFAFIKGTPRLLGSPFAFARHGKSGQELSEILPHLAGVADELAIVRSVHTDQFNHGPAQVLMNCGSALFGRPSMGAWATYGLGSANRNLPGFVVMLSGQNIPDGGTSCWSNGFLPSYYQGVQFRSTGDPVLALADPAGMAAGDRRAALDAIRALNQQRLDAIGDPEIATRIAAYELAFRMQTAVPELTDLATRDQGGARALRHRAGQGDVRQQLPDGAPPGRARRALRAALPPRLGPARRVRRQQHRQAPAAALRRHRPGRGRADHRPQAPRPARQHAGGVGRRVRAHADERGPRRRAVHGPRPPPARLHHVDGRRRHQAGRDHRRDRRAGLPADRRSGERARPARDHAAPAGVRAHQADLPLPGAGLQADGRGGRGGEEAAGVRRDPHPRG